MCTKRWKRIGTTMTENTVVGDLNRVLGRELPRRHLRAIPRCTSRYPNLWLASQPVVAKSPAHRFRAGSIRHGAGIEKTYFGDGFRFEPCNDATFRFGYFHIVFIRAATSMRICLALRSDAEALTAGQVPISKNWRRVAGIKRVLDA